MTVGHTGLDTAERLSFTLSAAAVAASLALGSALFAASVALGAAIEAANYRALRRACERLFSGEIAGGRAWGAGYALRFVFVGAAMGLALYAGAHPVGLVLGLSMIVPAVVVSALRARIPEAPATAVPPPDDASWEDWNPWLAREREQPDEDEQ